MSTPEQHLDRPLITLAQVSMTFAGHRVLEDVRLEVPRGQTLAVNYGVPTGTYASTLSFSPSSVTTG